MRECPVCRGSGQIPGRLPFVISSGVLYHHNGEVGLNNQQASVMETIMRKHPVATSKETIMWDLYQLRELPDNPSKVVDVVMYQLRKKVAPANIEIETTGEGYALRLEAA